MMMWMSVHNQLITPPGLNIIGIHGPPSLQVAPPLLFVNPRLALPSRSVGLTAQR